MTTRTTPVGRDRILETAEGLFTERGYRAVSIREIAQACSVTNAALYYYFDSKEDLFLEVLARHMENIRSRLLAAGSQTGPARERVKAMLVEYARVTADRRSPFFLFRREPGLRSHSEMHEVMRQGMSAILQPLEEVLAAAAERGEVRRLPEGRSPAALLIGMLHGLAQHRQACSNGDPIREADIELVVDLFWNGIGTES